MRGVVQFIRTLLGDRRAATAVEYGFILALIVLALMATLVELGNTTTRMWDDVSTKVQTAR